MAEDGSTRGKSGAIPEADSPRPLQGRRVLVTRSREQAGRLCELIRRDGGVPVEMATIRIEPTRDWVPVDAALARLGEYDWVVFSSANAVRIWMERACLQGLKHEEFTGLRIAAVGTSTQEELERHGLWVDLTPPRFVAESLLQALLETGVRGRRILLPAASDARDVLASGLREAGAKVDQIELYSSVLVEEDVSSVVAELETGRIHAATFTSSSTVRNFVRLTGDDKVARLLRNVKVICIGPVTAETAREHGLHVDAVATEHTVDGLAEALRHQLAARPENGDDSGVLL